MSIKVKLTVFFVFISLITIFLTSINNYKTVKGAFEASCYSKLVALREMKKREIENYYKGVEVQISALSSSIMVREASREFSSAFYKKSPSEAGMEKIREHVNTYYSEIYNRNLKEGDLSENAMIHQYDYIIDNPYPISLKDNYSDLKSRKQYNLIHSRYHPYFLNFKKKLGYHDIMIVDMNTGDVVYSTSKESDFAVNIHSDYYKNTPLADIVEKVKNCRKRDHVEMTDFEHYGPSFNLPLSFVGVPILNRGKRDKVFIVKLTTDRINQTMTGNYGWEKEGMGKTGETYLVGEDGRMRNDSRFFLENPDDFIKQFNDNTRVLNEISSNGTTVLRQAIDTVAVKKAREGLAGTEEIVGYRGESVLSSFASVNLLGLKWIIVAEMETAEAFEALDDIWISGVKSACLVLVFIIIISHYISNTITRPIFTLTRAMKKLGEGDFSRRLEVESRDELGKLTEYFNKSVAILKQTRIESITDPLTKIYNRLKFNEELEKEIDRVKRNLVTFSIIMFDVDYFKNINDKYGHEVGDQVLRELSALVKKSVRITDTLARWGGEEFILLAPCTPVDGALSLAEKIRKTVAGYSFGIAERVTCSFGVAEYEFQESQDSLKHRVDAALYKAKDKGRNNVQEAHTAVVV